MANRPMLKGKTSKIKRFFAKSIKRQKRAKLKRNSWKNEEIKDRKIGNKIFKYHRTGTNRKTAEGIQENLKSKGYQSRIIPDQLPIPFGWAYNVYKYKRKR